MLQDRFSLYHFSQVLHHRLSDFVPSTHRFKLPSLSHTKCWCVLSLCLHTIFYLFMVCFASCIFLRELVVSLLLDISLNLVSFCYYLLLPKPLCSDFCPHGVTDISLAKLIIRLLIAKVWMLFRSVLIWISPYVWCCRHFFPSRNPFFWGDFVFLFVLVNLGDFSVIGYGNHHLC